MSADTKFQDLLVPIFRDGKCVYDSPDVHDIRALTQRNLLHFHQGVKRFEHPHQYPVGIEKSLFDLKTELIFKARDIQR